MVQHPIAAAGSLMLCSLSALSIWSPVSNPCPVEELRSHPELGAAFPHLACLFTLGSSCTQAQMLTGGCQALELMDWGPHCPCQYPSRIPAARVVRCAEGCLSQAGEYAGLHLPAHSHPSCALLEGSYLLHWLSGLRSCRLRLPLSPHGSLQLRLSFQDVERGPQNTAGRLTHALLLGMHTESRLQVASSALGGTPLLHCRAEAAWALQSASGSGTHRA